MLVIGIVGGIAGGKSLVAEQFRQLGAVVLDADKLGHQVLRLDEVKKAVRREFGGSVFSDDGEVIRSRLAEIVFNNEDRSRLAVLESITHPRIRERLNQQLDELRSDGRTKAVVLDVPLLFESEWHPLCDRIVFIDVPFAVRQKRTITTRNWDADELTHREKRQTPVAIKMELADERIDNSGSREFTFEQVRQLWNKWGLQPPVRQTAAS